nr:hypothetical protein Iba_chr06bCG14340 [Ipomoea batatas]
MGESPHTILELTARLLVYTEQQGLFHKQYPIVSDDSWLYFVNQTSRLGELHVYVTATTNSSFMGLLTGLTQFSEGGSGSSSYNICSSSEPFVDFSHYAQKEQNSDSSTSSSEEEIEPTSDHSNGEDRSLSQQVSLRRGAISSPSPRRLLSRFSACVEAISSMAGSSIRRSKRLRMNAIDDVEVALSPLVQVDPALDD